MCIWCVFRYLGFKKSIVLDRRKLVELLDSYTNQTVSWNEFVSAVQLIHENRMGQPAPRKAISDKPKEEDYFYSNPQECLCNAQTACRTIGNEKGVTWTGWLPWNSVTNCILTGNSQPKSIRRQWLHQPTQLDYLNTFVIKKKYLFYQFIL